MIDALHVDNESGAGTPADKEMITDFNFPNADIIDLAKTMGRLTGKNFIFDKDVKGSVTIISNSPVTVGDAWRAFLTELDVNQLAIVPSGKYLRIMRQNDAKGKNVRLYSETRAPNTDALVTKIFKIKYINAKELENVIRTYANMGARIYGYEQTNTLIITDTGSNIEKVAKMIAFLDVEGFDAGIEIIQVKYASAVELQKLIDSLLPGTQSGGFPGRPGGFPGSSGRSGGGFSARKTKEGGIVNNIIPDERTNTLIVHANPKGVEQIREIVNRLDRKMPAIAAGGGKIHVLPLQFADSEEMAKTLNNFSQTSKTGGNAGGFPGGPIGGIGMNPNESNLFEGQIKVSADKATNSLVITASPADYAVLQRVIFKLDIPREQVYVEIVIMEMQMDRSNEYTANLLGPNGTSIAPTSDLANLIANPASAASSKGLILRWASQNTTPQSITANGQTTTVQIPNLAALIRAIQTSSNANILATPQLMTMDNVEATFESTDKIPIPTVNNVGLGISTTSYNNTVNVPLSIKIKPQLNKISNFIKLDIKANVTDYSSKQVSDVAPSILERKAETSVMVSDSDTVVLGGLVRDKTTEAVSKVPLLGDIPILGWLFKSKNSTVSKSNLMLFITPKVMRQPENLRMVLDQKLKDRDEFVEKSMGGEDTQREHRNQMIRSLPDIRSIKNYNAKRVLNLDDEDSVKENSKEDAMNEITTPDGVTETPNTLTLPPADLVPEHPPAMPPMMPIPVPPPVSTQVVPTGPIAPPVPSNDNFAPINPQGNPNPLATPNSDPFAVPATGVPQ